MAEVRPRFRWNLSTVGSFEPVTTADLKSHLRVEHAVDDALIASLGAAARSWCELKTNHIMTARTVTLEASGFPSDTNDIVLPIGPVTAITAVSYINEAGTVVTMTANTDYRADAAVNPARIRLPLSASTVEWPATYAASDAVRITATAGYANIQAVPEVAKHAMRLLVGHWYENREAVVTGTISSNVGLTVEALLSTLRTGELLL